MNKSILFLFCTFFICTQVKSQRIFISQQETNRNLLWTDFSTVDDNHSRWNAYTYYELNWKSSDIQINGNGDSISIGTFEVTLEFDSEKSWVKAEKKTEELLLHEQGHFNLGILCMREMLMKIKNTNFSKSNYDEAIENVCNTIMNKYDGLGSQYDEETNHYQNKEQQLEWNSYFIKEMANSVQN